MELNWDRLDQVSCIKTSEFLGSRNDELNGIDI